MDTRQIEYILAIAQERNMTKAARKVYISQPTLSQALAKLEQELGQPLFVRRHGEMIPTAAGMDYINTAAQVLQLKQRLYRKIQMDSGHMNLSIGVSSHWAAAMVSRVVCALQKEETVTCSLHIVNEGPAQLMERMWKKTLDMVIITAETPDQYPKSEVLYQEEILLAVPDQDEIRKCLPDGGDVGVFLQKHAIPAILAEQGTPLRKLEDDFLLSLGVVPNIICEMRDMTDALHMVASGIGIAFIPASRKPANKKSSTF